MAFKSQFKESKSSSRRGSKSLIQITQSFKKSTNSEEMSIRPATSLLNKVNLTHGDRVDVLYDPEEKQWMITPDKNGFNISGKEGSPTGLIRYTLKEGHVRFTNNKDELPIKKECNDESIVIENGSIIFSLNDDE
jgi:hypothetical protein